MLKLGIIGVGNIGSGHVQRVTEGSCPNITITAVADRRASRREWARKQLPEAQIFVEGSDMIKSGACDAVLIATPHYQHPTLAVEAFENGLHVLCEKPAGVYTLQVRDMMAVADKRPDLTFAMMFNQRTNCVYRKMKEMIDGGEIGEIKRMNWIVTDWYRTQYYYDSGAWRATWAGEGGGVLLNQCPHQLDLLQWLCGLPAKVHAFAHEGKWHDVEVEDDVTAYLEFPNGATGVFITTTGDAHGTNRLEIQMDKAKIVSENAQITLLEYDIAESEFTKTNTVPFGSVPAHAVEVTTDGKNEQHVGVLNAWADAILRGGEMIAHGEEGINGLTLSNAMHLSSFLGKTIELPLDEDLYYEELMKRVATSRLKENVNAVVADTSNTYGGAK